MSRGSWEYIGLYMILVISCCLFFGLLYAGLYAVLMIFEVIPRTIYKLWKEIRNERNARNERK